MCRHATKWNSSGPTRAQWCNQQSWSNPKWTNLACLCYVFLTKSVCRFLSNVSSRGLRWSMIASRPYRPNHHSSTALLCLARLLVRLTSLRLGLLQALARVEGKCHCFRLLRESDTGNAAPSEHSNDVAQEIVSSSEEDENDRPRALLSAVPSGTSAAAPGDKDRTRRVVVMDSVHFPDAVMSSGMVADGSVAYAKTTTTLYEQAGGPEPTPKTSSWTAGKEEWHGDYGLQAFAAIRGHEPKTCASRRIIFSPSLPLLRHDVLCKPLAHRDGRSARGRRRRRAHISPPPWGTVKRDTLTLCMAQPQQKGGPRYLVSGWSFD
jgi:hypothetical protein